MDIKKLNIKSVFEETCTELIIDEHLAKRVITYETLFANKNDEHIKFFGGNLTGVEVVRFTITDRGWWFEDVLNTDEHSLHERLLKLPEYARNEEYRQVASDVMNISCGWIVHVLLTAKNISEKLKHDACVSALLVLQYKFLTSRLFRHYSYPADKPTAEAAYAALSKKFALKQYGSWGATLKARAEDILLHSGLHYKTLMNFDDDVGIEKFLNDTQTRIRDMLKNIANVHYQVEKEGKKIISNSSVVEYDGEEILKDRTKSLATYTRYLESIISDKNSFIREELLVIIEQLIPSMPPSLFRKTLIWISDNYHGGKADEISEVVRETLVHSFDYMVHNHAIARNGADIAGLLVRLKGIYTSARSTDPVLFALREKMESIVIQATGTKNQTMLSPVRTGVLMYAVLRAITKNHYTNTI